MDRRTTLQGIGTLLAAPVWRLAAAADPATLRRVGVVSLLGDSIRIYARENREALFADVGMDEIVFDSADRVLAKARPSAELRHFRSAVRNMDVDDQIALGTAAGRSGTLPEWLLKEAREADLSHVLLVGSDNGAMEFKTGMTQVVGNGRVNGVGFWVGADHSWKNEETGDTYDGYLAPFVQLRITLVELQGSRVLNSKRISEGYAASRQIRTAYNPWDYLNRAQKAAALQGLLRRNITRGVETVLQE